MRVCEQFLSGSNKCNDDDDVGIRNKRKGKTGWQLTGLGKNFVASFSALFVEAKAVVFTILHYSRTYPALAAVMGNVPNLQPLKG